MLTIASIPNDLWGAINNILPEDEKPENTIERPILPYGKVLDGVVFVLRTGSQWKLLPKKYASGSTCHRRFQESMELGIFDLIWIRSLKLNDKKIGIKCNWESIN